MTRTHERRDRQDGDHLVRLGTTTLEAEDGALAGDADAVVLGVRWTGESLYGGTGYAASADGGTATCRVDGPRSRVIPVFDLRRAARRDGFARR